MELGARRPSLLWFWGPNSIFCSVYGPSGFGLSRASRVLDAQNPRLLGRGGGVILGGRDQGFRRFGLPFWSRVCWVSVHAFTVRWAPPPPHTCNTYMIHDMRTYIHAKLMDFHAEALKGWLANVC